MRCSNIYIVTPQIFFLSMKNWECVVLYSYITCRKVSCVIFFHLNEFEIWFGEYMLSKHKKGRLANLKLAIVIRLIMPSFQRKSDWLLHFRDIDSQRLCASRYNCLFYTFFRGFLHFFYPKKGCRRLINIYVYIKLTDFSVTKVYWQEVYWPNRYGLTVFYAQIGSRKVSPI